MKSLFFFISLLFFSDGFSNNTEISIETFDAIKIITQPQNANGFAEGHDVVFSNGPLVNSKGTGIGGADESILQDVSLGLTTLGIGHQQSQDARISDDFRVENDGLIINAIDFFAYQTGEQASTITAINLRIWDGRPGQAGSRVIYGDTSTNVLTSTAFSGILRVRELDSGINNIRQIATSTVAVDLTLDAGTYWLDWQVSGSGNSGPWAPPVSIEGQTNTGNALRSQDNGLTYSAALDAGLNTPMGFPFVLRGSLRPPVPVNTLSYLGYFVLMTLMLVFSAHYLNKKITTHI